MMFNDLLMFSFQVIRSRPENGEGGGGDRQCQTSVRRTRQRQIRQ